MFRPTRTSLGKIFVFISLFLFSVKTAGAEQIYTWKDCIEIALQNNADLKSAIATEQSNKAAQSGSWSNFLPQLSANTSSTRSQTNSSNLASNSSFFYTTNTASLNLNQNLFNGFQDKAKVEQAKANVLLAQAGVKLVKAQVSYALKVSYEGLRYAKSYLNLLDNIIKRRQDNLNIVELRFKGGMENKGSLLLARAYLSDAKYNRLQAENLAKTAHAQLCKVMGLRECIAFDIVDGIPTKAPQYNPNLAEIVITTPQHLQAVAQENAAKAGVTIAESGFFPTVNVMGLSGQRGTTYLPQNNYWSIGLNVSFPFFSGGKDYYATQSAMSTKSAANNNRLSIDRQALADLQQSYNSYIESVAKLEVSQNYKEAAQMRAQIARNKYNNGLLIFENWDVIETDLINRQTAFLQSERDRVIFEAAFEQIQGKGIYDQ
jgi:outer membrane protein